MDRFYVECVNHHVGYYAIFDRETMKPAKPIHLIEYGDIEDNEFGYAKEAQMRADKMNRSRQFELTYLANLTVEDYVQVQEEQL